MKRVSEIYSEMAKAYPPWSDEEEREFIQSCITPTGEWRDKEHFVTEAMKHNMNLVFSLVRKFSFKTNEDDVFQCAVIAMVNSLKKFNPNKGYKISTWITNPIIWAIKRERTGSAEACTIAEEIKHKKHYSSVCSIDDAAFEGISDSISTSNVDINYLILNGMKPHREEQASLEVKLGIEELMLEIHNILSEKEIFVVKGLLLGRKQNDISMEMNISRMRVSQLSASAFKKIRKSKLGRNLFELISK